MKNQNGTNRRSVSEDLAKIFLISEAPKLAKLLVDAIPDLTYERYMKDYKTIWNIALPVASFAILRKYADSELEKTFTVQMSAGISRAINERAKKMPSNYADNPRDNEPQGSEPKPTFRVKDCISFLNGPEFELFTNRLNSLPVEQRDGLLNSEVPSDDAMRDMISILQENGIFPAFEEDQVFKIYHCEPEKIMKICYLESILSFRDDQFKEWASMNFDPERKKRIAQKIAQKIAALKD